MALFAHAREFRFLSVGVNQFKAQVVRSKADRQKGLLGRNNLKKEQAMVFVYHKPQLKQFHMQGMKFSLDIIWCLKGRVKTISHNVPPNSKDLNLLQSKGFVDMVIEIAAGEAKASGILPGSKVRLGKLLD